MGWYDLPVIGEIRTKAVELFRFDSATSELVIEMQSGKEHRVAVVDEADAIRIKNDIKAA